jgi:DNA-directed RNA polymerase specialized sigma24 family protein
VNWELRKRAVLEHFDRFGHSCEQIAEMVDCPTNTVKWCALVTILKEIFHGY